MSVSEITSTPVPVKLWTPVHEVESAALDQLKNVARLPWVFHHVASMPDVHFGKGCTVGSVIAMKGAVSPAAVGVDIGCFTGDTRVRCLDGKSRSLAEMATTGEEHWIFANDGQRIVPAKGKTQKTRSNAELVAIVLDTGERIRCTPDHEFMLRDGSYQRADMLAPGASLMPFYTRTDELGYIRIKQTDTGNWRSGHWLVADAGILGHVQQFAEQRTIIHHRNFDGSDNRPENLQFMGDRDHSTYHRSLAERNEYWQSPAFEAARLEGIRKMAATPEGHAFLAKRGTQNITKYMDEHREEFLAAIADNGKRGKEYLLKYNSSEKGRAKSREVGRRNGQLLCSCSRCGLIVKTTLGLWNHQQGKRCEPEVVFNHKVVAVERLQEREDVYCMVVPELHNFALEAGVFVHNCGMGAVKTNLKASDLPENLAAIRADIERHIPVGFNEHQDTGYISMQTWAHGAGVQQQDGTRLARDFEQLFREFKDLDPHVKDLLGKAMRQVGTLGGGNHFIELCLDNGDCPECEGRGDCDQDQFCSGTGKVEPNVWLMLHSGSRNIGKTLAEVHIWRARELAHNQQLPDRDLAVFLAGTPEMAAYRRDLFWAQRYAFINRRKMFEIYKAIVVAHFPWVKFEEPILCHHNYVSEEVHYGEEVVVTRKGAIDAHRGVMGIIPGSMGTKSYIVRGLGSEESFCSASHGAGRRMSRGKAKKAFTLEDLAAQTAGVECRKDQGVLDEIPGAYKDIDQVMLNQTDLVEVVAELKGLMCIKG